MAMYQVIGYGADGNRIVDAMTDDETSEGPRFYAFKALHATGVVCAQIFPVGAPGEVVTAILTECDPGVDWEDIAAAIEAQI